MASRDLGSALQGIAQAFAGAQEIRLAEALRQAAERKRQQAQQEAEQRRMMAQVALRVADLGGETSGMGLPEPVAQLLAVLQQAQQGAAEQGQRQEVGGALSKAALGVPPGFVEALRQAQGQVQGGDIPPESGQQTLEFILDSVRKEGQAGRAALEGERQQGLAEKQAAAEKKAALDEEATRALIGQRERSNRPKPKQPEPEQGPSESTRRTIENSTRSRLTKERDALTKALQNPIEVARLEALNPSALSEMQRRHQVLSDPDSLNNEVATEMESRLALVEGSAKEGADGRAFSQDELANIELAVSDIQQQAETLASVRQILFQAYPSHRAAELFAEISRRVKSAGP